MKFLRKQLDQVHDLVKPDGKLGKIPGAYTVYDMHDTILFTQGTTTPKDSGPHVRDALDSKRLMFSVVVALVPCIIWAIYNTGAQALAHFDAISLVRTIGRVHVWGRSAEKAEHVASAIRAR